MHKRIYNILLKICISICCRLRLQILSLFKNELLVIGDSHVKTFDCFGKWLPKNYFVNVVSVTGSTASGLSNPRSKTKSYTKFRVALRRTKAKIVLIQLGEVDTGFVIWWRSQKHNTDVDEMLDLAVSSYVSFINEIKDEGFEVVCISSALPTISDDAPIGEVALYRREVKANQVMRTNLTLRFNSKVQEKVTNNGIEYLNLDKLSLGENGLVADSLLNADPSDHHYNITAYESILYSYVWPVVLAKIG